MKIKKRYVFIFELLLLGVTSLIPLIWFKPEHMIFGSDSGYPLDYVLYFIQRTFTWSPALGFGYDMSSAMGAVPLHGIQYLISIIGVPYFYVQKVTFVFWFAAVALSMYFCVKSLFGKPDEWPIRIIATLLYCINFYIFLFWQIGSQTTLSAYVFLPISFLIIYRFINNDVTPFKAAVYFNVAYLLCNAGGVQGVPLLGSSLVLVLVILMYQSILTFNKGYFLNILKLTLYTVLIFFLCNSYFLIPFISSFNQQFNTLVDQSGGISGVISWTRNVSEFSSYTNLLRLQGDKLWYIKNASYPSLFTTNPLLIILSFLFPFFAYLSLFFKVSDKTKKLLYALVAISIIGIFLSAGSHEPLGFIYELMLQHIPGFAAFRSGYYKFAPMTYFSFAILCGISICYISKKFSLRVKIIAPILFISFILVYHYPFYNSENFKTTYMYPIMVKIPSYVQEFANLQKTTDNKYRTLVLPPLNSSNTIEEYKWGYYGGYPIFPGISDNSFVENNSYLTQNEKTLVNNLYDLLRENDIAAFLQEANRLSIKYILVTSDVVTDNPDHPRENPQYYDLKLNNSNFEVSWKKGPWTLYEIKGTKINPKIYSFNKLVAFNGNLDDMSQSKDEGLNFIQGQQAVGIPIIKSVNVLSCASCYVKSGDSLDVKTPMILPNSILYKVKHFLEKKAVIGASPHDKTYDNLGKSLKRLAEIKGLYGVVDNRSFDNWIDTSRDLESNWMQLLKLSGDKEISTNVSILNDIEMYAEFEQSELRDLYFYIKPKSASLSKEIKNISSKISETQSVLESKINKVKNENTEVFNVDYNLAKGKKLILETKGSNPYALKYDSSEIIYIGAIKDNRIELPKTKDKFSQIVFFNNPQTNLTNTYEKTIINSSFFRKEECLLYRIPNYKWYVTYNVTSKIYGDNNGLDVYYLNKDPEINSDIRADNSIDIDNRNIHSLDFNISGDESDKKMLVLFCVPLGRNPENVYKDVKIYETSKDKLYIETESRIENKPMPKITFQMISPTSYKASISGAESPYFLGFSEKYSDAWKMKGDIATTEYKHFVLNGYSNGWYIKKTGSYDLVLNFDQQKKFEFGSVISSISILIVLCYFVRGLFKNDK